MTNPQKRRGDAAEREAAALISDHLGFPVRRALGAGRQDDIGDIHGLPQTSLQIANYASLDRAVREKLPDVDRQMANMGASFGALFCRRRGGGFVVVQTPAQWFAMWREATADVESGICPECASPKHRQSKPRVFEACGSAGWAREWIAYLWHVRHERDGVHRPFLRFLIERARA